MSEEVKEIQLKGKQKLFADRYLYETMFNGTEAARGIYGAKNDTTLRSIASENLTKPNIKAYIDARMAEMTMPANEVLTRLTSIAKGKVTDVLDESGKFDIHLAKQRHKDHLLKKLKVKRTSRVVNIKTKEFEEEEVEEITETSVLTEEIEFEMYSAHEALRDLGKHHKLFTEKLEHSGEIQHGVVRVPPKDSPEKWLNQSKQ
jgi:phage terminase small subunit